MMKEMDEAGIDFTDQEDVVAIGREALLAGLHAAVTSLRTLLDGSVPLERLVETPWVVLTGPANAGKSALFNALTGARQKGASRRFAGGRTRERHVGLPALRMTA